MPTTDSSIRSEGAELFVQAILMLEYGVITSRASRNMPGYDIIAHNLKDKIDCRISVKYRKASDCDGFQFTQTDGFDFFVGVLGQRGKVGPNSAAEDKMADELCQAFVLSLKEVKNGVRSKGKKFLLPRKNVLIDKRKGDWNRILEFLKVQSDAASSTRSNGK